MDDVLARDLRGHEGAAPDRASSALRSAGFALLLAALVFALYRKALRLWWTFDDPYLVHVAIANDAPGYLFDATFWRGTPGRMFVPLLTGTFELLYAAFGEDARGYYAVQLVLFAAAAIAVFAALRLFCSRVAAITGALLFVAGPPLCALATQLMVIHYHLAILLGALAVIAFVREWRVVSAILYFLAMLAKEIAIPLPGVLLLLPARDLRTRIQRLIAHAIAVVAYFAWRWWTIGTPLGGYGWAVGMGDLPSLPWRMIKIWAGSNLAVGLALIAVVAAAIVAGLRGRRLAFLGFALLLAVAPVLPVSRELQPRYGVAAWLVLAAAFAIAIDRSRIRIPLAAVAIVLALVANRQEWAAEYARAQRMSDELRFFASSSANDLVRAPAVPPATLTELRWLAETHRRRAPIGNAFYDDLYLCAGGPGARRVWEYDVRTKTLADITRSLPRLTKRHCGAIRNDAPLAAKFDHRDESLYWTFGPYRDGKWRAVIANGVQAFDLPREGGFRLPGVSALPLRIRYDSPAGWTTYSPELALDFVHHPRYEWKR